MPCGACREFLMQLSYENRNMEIMTDYAERKTVTLGELMPGYYIAEEYWGKGIMTDAVKQICEYVFKNSDILRIYAEPFAYNIGSCRVLEKTGFQYEGTLRNNAVKNGKVIDMKMYSLLREEQ